MSEMPIEEERERITNLFRSVIVLAYKDYCSSNALLEWNVKMWVDSKDFVTICDLANANPSLIRHHILTRSKDFKDIIRLFTDTSRAVNNGRK